MNFYNPLLFVVLLIVLPVETQLLFCVVVVNLVRLCVCRKRSIS